jgi:hypothetical protein
MRLLTLQSSRIVCIGSELHERVFAAHLTSKVGLFASATPKHQHQHSNTEHLPSTTHKQDKRHSNEKTNTSNHHINKVANQTRCASSSPSLSSKAAAALGAAPWTNARMRQPQEASSQSAPWRARGGHRGRLPPRQILPSLCRVSQPHSMQHSCRIAIGKLTCSLGSGCATTCSRSDTGTLTCSSGVSRTPIWPWWITSIAWTRPSGSAVLRRSPGPSRSFSHRQCNQ